MITWPKATLAVTGACAVIVCGLAGCNKAPSQEGAAPQAAATAGSSAKSTSPLAAELQEPPLAPPDRTDPQSIATRQTYIQWVKGKAIPAGLHKPTLPDPNRTDGAAILQRYKYGLWGAAETLVATDAALKQQEQFYGPVPKGNYGKMAQGLKPLPADKK